MSTDVWFLNVHQMAPLHFGINRLSGHWLLVTPQHQWPSEDSDQWGHIRRLPRKKKRNCFNISALLANRKQLDRCLPMCLILAASASVAQQVAYWMLLLALHSPHCTWSFCQKKKKLLHILLTCSLSLNLAMLSHAICMLGVSPRCVPNKGGLSAAPMQWTALFFIKQKEWHHIAEL